MRISRDLRRFHLHDSWVDAINYMPEDACLEIVLDLCDDIGGIAGGDNPEEEIFGQSGRLVFYDVAQLDADWEDLAAAQDCEILNLEHKPSLDAGDLECVWGVFDLHEQDEDGVQRILEITFLAYDFEWYPES